MPLREGPSATRRRRRTPEAAQREIIEAADALLRERPFRELTVDEVMRRTGLSRPSFYVYFKDRHELVLRLVQHLNESLLEMANVWYEASSDGEQRLRRALDGVVAVYAAHAPVLRALADASVDDPDVEHAYGSMIQGFVDVTTQHISDEVQAGRMLPVDPQETAKALTWMGERYLYRSFGDLPVPPAATIAETLYVIFTRSLYGAR